MFELWLTLRLLKEGKSQFLNPVSWLAVTGMALGVATLIIVMGVVSGFESTLENAVTDVTGDILLIRRGEPLDNLDILMPRLKKVAPQIVSATPFVHVEGMLAHKGKVGGIVIQGLDPGSSQKTLNLSGRIKEGTFDLGTGNEENPPVLIGKGLKEKMGINVGDIINIVLPKNSPTAKVTGFVPQLKKFLVVGVVDLGMYEFDSRFIITSARAAQKLADKGPFYTGLRLKLSDSHLAPQVSLALSAEMGFGYLIRDWMEAHNNLFEAIKLEKIVIFLVLLFMTVAACFNVSSTLLISVLRRTHDIALLKALGAKNSSILRFFSLQGLLLGVMGNVLGVILGLTICFIITKTNIIFLPPEIYHLSRLPVEIRFKEMGMIIVASLFLCLISTWGPARRAAKLLPVDGLRYE